MFAQIVSSLPIPIFLLDEACKITYMNEASCRLFGKLMLWSEFELLLKEQRASVKMGRFLTTDEHSIDLTMVTVTGEDMPVLLTKCEPAVGTMILAFPKTGDTPAAQLWQANQYDPLTGLPNRGLLRDRIDQVLKLGKRRQLTNPFAVLCLDLDGFKPINDTYGHKVGDRVLQIVAQRLTSSVRDSDTVSRVGGDEFVCFLSNLLEADDSRVVAERILEELRKPLIVDDHVLSVSTSIGIALWPNDSESVDQLLSFSDMAMYSVKQAGKNGVGFFHPQIDEEARSRAEVESDLREALRLGQFLLHYQPQFCLQTGRLKGVEALIRWKQPDRGMVLPGDFIDIAEETDLIHQIGDWVLVEASRQARKWLNVGYSIKVAVNISARQFVDTLPDRLEEILQNFKLPASMLELELTESALVLDHASTAKILEKIRDMGVHTSLDDFGTGFSSLNYLKSFPLRTLKIDRSFVGPTFADFQPKMIRAILAIAKEFNLTTLAEGVENQEQLDALRDMGCDYVQGFYLARPMAPDKLIQFLNEYDAQLSAAVRQ
jgi:diguanylate cyclase (GGDEF)-like protein